MLVPKCNRSVTAAMAPIVTHTSGHGVDGSQIEAMHQAGLHPQIESYCLSDVAQTALLFLRFRLLQGVLDRTRYVAAAAALAAALAADPRVSELSQAIDGQRLLSAA